MFNAGPCGSGSTTITCLKIIKSESTLTKIQKQNEENLSLTRPSPLAIDHLPPPPLPPKPLHRWLFCRIPRLYSTVTAAKMLPIWKKTLRFNPTCSRVPADADGCCWERWRCAGCGELLLNCCCCCWQDADGLLAGVSACHCRPTQGICFPGFADPHHFHDIIQTHEDANPDSDFCIKQSFSMFNYFPCTVGTAVQTILILKERQTCCKVWLWCHKQQIRENKNHSHIQVYSNFSGKKRGPIFWCGHLWTTGILKRLNNRYEKYDLQL